MQLLLSGKGSISSGKSVVFTRSCEPRAGSGVAGPLHPATPFVLLGAPTEPLEAPETLFGGGPNFAGAGSAGRLDPPLLRTGPVLVGKYTAQFLKAVESIQ